MQEEDAMMTSPENPEKGTLASSHSCQENESIDDYSFFIGDLFRNVSRKEVFDLFKPFGTVLEVTLKRSSVNSLMKYGFVRMSNEKEMENCLRMDKALTLRNRRLRLSRIRHESCLLVHNLDPMITADELNAVFRVFGALHEEYTKVGLRLDGNYADQYGVNDEIGIVRFHQRNCAARAKRYLQGYSLGRGSEIIITWAPAAVVSSIYDAIGDKIQESIDDDHNQGDASGGDEDIPNSSHVKQSLKINSVRFDECRVPMHHARSPSVRNSSFGNAHSMNNVNGRGYIGKQEILSLYVRFLALQDVVVDESIIFNAFLPFGNVTGAVIKRIDNDEASNYQRGYAFVHYNFTLSGRNSALTAVSCLNNTYHQGIHFIVEPSRNFMTLDDKYFRSQCVATAWQPAISPINIGVYPGMQGNGHLVCPAVGMTSPHSTEKGRMDNGSYLCAQDNNGGSDAVAVTPNNFVYSFYAPTSNFGQNYFVGGVDPNLLMLSDGCTYPYGIFSSGAVPFSNYYYNGIVNTPGLFYQYDAPSPQSSAAYSPDVEEPGKNDSHDSNDNGHAAGDNEPASDAISTKAEN